jgi:hypothetical protein
MTKKLICILFGGIGLVSFFVISCTKQDEQALIDQSGIPPCDTSNMSYSTDIVPILENNCVSCHNPVQNNLGVILTNYSDVLTQVNNGHLVNVIEHNPGYPQMPFGLPQLPSCTINEIVDWVNRGAPNN